MGATGDIIFNGAQHAFSVDAAVLIKATVFYGQDRVFHVFWHIFNFDVSAPLFTKFGN